MFFFQLSILLSSRYIELISKSYSALEDSSQSGFGVSHGASDQRREPMPDAEEEAAGEAELQYRSDRQAVGGDRPHDPGHARRRQTAEGVVTRAGRC
jgi:hypothetical protein